LTAQGASGQAREEEAASVYGYTGTLVHSEQTVRQRVARPWTRLRRECLRVHWYTMTKNSHVEPEGDGRRVRPGSSRGRACTGTLVRYEQTVRTPCSTAWANKHEAPLNP